MSDGKSFERRNRLFFLSFHFLKTPGVIIYWIKTNGDMDIDIYLFIHTVERRRKFLFRNKILRANIIKL